MQLAPRRAGLVAARRGRGGSGFWYTRDRASILVPSTPTHNRPFAMSDVRLRARSATEIVDAALQIYRRDPMTYVLVCALAYTPWLVLQLSLVGIVTEPEEILTVYFSGAGIVLAVGYWVSLSLMSAVLVKKAADDYLGRGSELGTIVREVLPRLPAVMIGALVKYFFLFLGFLVFLVGALWVVARYFAINQAIVLEGSGVGRALGRSAALSRGNKLHILGTLLLVVIILIVIAVGVAIIGQLTGSPVIGAVLSTVGTIVSYPMFAITEMLLYYDARIRNEGYDIEVMAEGLAAPAAP